MKFLGFYLRELPFFDFNKVAIVLINFLIFFLFVSVNRQRKFRDFRQRIFALMGVFMFLWVNFAFLARLFGLYPQIATMFLRIAWSATPPLFYLSFLFLIDLINQRERFKTHVKLFFFLVSLLSLITLFTNFTVRGISFSSGYLDIIYGAGFGFFLLVVFLLIILTLVPIFSAKLDESVRVFLLGLIIFYFNNLFFNIILPVFFRLTFLYWVGDYSTIFLLAASTYSIMKYKFLNIEVLASEFFVLFTAAILFLQMLVSKTAEEKLIDFFLFASVIFLGTLLIRSLRKELAQRQELEILNTKLKELDQRKDEFVSMAAHELRSPMTAIKGFVSMILDGDVGEISAKAREYLLDVKNINDMMIRLVNNMLNVSKIEQGKMVFNEEEDSLSRLAQIVFNQFFPEVERKGLRYELDLPRDIRDKVRVDVDRIQEVMGNLISNAVKYTDKGFVKVRLLQPSKKTIRFEVEDSGPGISEEEQKKLFQKFYRVETNIGKTTGTGLGLYISKLIVEKFGGKIGVKSKVGFGSTFWFELPLVGS